MTTLRQESIQSTSEFSGLNDAAPLSRLPLDERIAHILNMSEADVAKRLMGLVALTNDIPETSETLVDAIEDVSDQVLTEMNDEDYALGEIVALVDAAHITGNKHLAQKALDIVHGTLDIDRFGIDTRAAVQISANEDMTFEEAMTAGRTLRGARALPITDSQEEPEEHVPVGQAYESVYSPNSTRNPRKKAS